MARIAFFAFDIAEAAQIRRIRSVQSLGHEVVSLSYRRANMNREFQPDWPDHALGRTANAAFLRRIGQLGTGVIRAFRSRRAVSGSHVWIARNFDLLLIAFALKILTGRSDVRLVYECLDIHGLFTRADAIGRAMRWAERGLLRRTSLLIVSSPGFIESYFRPVQAFDGPAALIENKLWLGREAWPRPQVRAARAQGGPLVLGWVGSLRCQSSLEIIAGAAQLLGPDLKVEFHGNVHRHAVPGFDEVVRRHPNITYKGPYQYPADLEAIYTSCDLVWAQDLWQQGANSDWLLPNRIYEASYFGCPSIALAGTQTGRRVAEGKLGFTVEEATPEALAGLLQSIGETEVRAASQRLLAAPDSDFRLMPEELEAALSPVLDTLPSQEAGAA